MIYKDSLLHFNQPHPGSQVKTWISCLLSEIDEHTHTSIQLKISSPDLVKPVNQTELSNQDT